MKHKKDVGRAFSGVLAANEDERKKTKEKTRKSRTGVTLLRRSTRVAPPTVREKRRRERKKQGRRKISVVMR